MIRPFHTKDALSCCSLILACLEADVSYSGSLRRKLCAGETPQAMEDRARSYYIAVFEEEERILGVAGLDLNEICLLYVSPEYGRRGIGRNLLEHLVSMVPRTLFSDVFLYSTQQAVDFYKSCGFAERGPHDFELDGESLPTIFMTLDLSGYRLS